LHRHQRELEQTCLSTVIAGRDGVQFLEAYLSTVLRLDIGPSCRVKITSRGKRCPSPCKVVNICLGKSSRKWTNRNDIGGGDLIDGLSPHSCGALKVPLHLRESGFCVLCITCGVYWVVVGLTGPIGCCCALPKLVGFFFATSLQCIIRQVADCRKEIGPEA
jgi:hypothetical protein